MFTFGRCKTRIGYMRIAHCLFLQLLFVYKDLGCVEVILNKSLYCILKKDLHTVYIIIIIMMIIIVIIFL